MSTYAGQDAPSPGRVDAEVARRRLEQERQNRLDQLTDLQEGSGAGSDDVASVQRATNQRVLKDIDAAMEQLEAGTYGDCRRCERPIPVERLEILPYARYCVKCQQKVGR